MNHVKAILSALRLTYLQDLPSHLDELEQLVLKLESGGFQRELGMELYRQIHSLKGSGGTYGLHVLTNICHPFEDLIAAFLEGAASSGHNFAENALTYLDLLRLAQSTYARGDEPGTEIETALQSLRKKISPTILSALIVDASEVVVAMLSDVLKINNFRCEAANDGYEALGRTLSEQFDVVITGLETKRLNGLALIAAIKKSGIRNAKTKTILITSTQLKMSSDMPDFVLKKDAELKEKLNKILNNVFRVT